MSPLETRAFADHFSAHAASYAEFRPRYPAALFHWLAVVSPGTVQAWDAGTGNGQVALGLVSRFARVRATDASAEQIAAAQAHPRIAYAVAQYESGLPAESAQLVTAGQALHWFDVDEFAREARRVLQPGGILAAFGYKHSRVADEIDEVVRRYMEITIGQFWPPEHRVVNDEYRAIALPIDELVPPPLELREDWSLAQYAGFFRTWSGTRRYIAARGEEGVLQFEQELAAVWGAPARRAVRWELFVRAGEVR